MTQTGVEVKVPATQEQLGRARDHHRPAQVGISPEADRLKPAQRAVKPPGRAAFQAAFQRKGQVDLITVPRADIGLHAGEGGVIGAPRHLWFKGREPDLLVYEEEVGRRWTGWPWPGGGQTL